MDQYYVLGSLVASVMAMGLLYNLLAKRNGRGEGNAAAAAATATTTTTTEISGECRSKNDADVIIVGAGVAGAALAHTLGKVRIVFRIPSFALIWR